MRFLGVIPARYGSTRLPAKPLIKIAEKPLLEWVISGAKEASSLDELVVATDHKEIAQLAEKCGVEAILTDSELPSGSDRVWAAAKTKSADVVLNIQGDEPLLRGHWIDKVTALFKNDANLQMATVAHAIKEEELAQIQAVKVILNAKSDAIYFSRLPIPYTRMNYKDAPGMCLKHIGLYGYKKEFLQKFCATAPTPLERCESLEQLRAMYLGATIRVAPIEAYSIGIDTPDDIKQLTQYLEASRGN
jgi:3-deoxy-manno-octulosonate cytidylyltransferase (CMP-KDO synthetase)